MVIVTKQDVIITCISDLITGNLPFNIALTNANVSILQITHDRK